MEMVKLSRYIHIRENYTTIKNSDFKEYENREILRNNVIL